MNKYIKFLLCLFCFKTVSCSDQEDRVRSIKAPNLAHTIRVITKQGNHWNYTDRGLLFVRAREKVAGVLSVFYGYNEDHRFVKRTYRQSSKHVFHRDSVCDLDNQEDVERALYYEKNWYSILSSCIKAKDKRHNINYAKKNKGIKLVDSRVTTKESGRYCDTSGRVWVMYEDVYWNLYYDELANKHKDTQFKHQYPMLLAFDTDNDYEYGRMQNGTLFKRRKDNHQDCESYTLQDSVDGTYYDHYERHISDIFLNN